MPTHINHRTRHSIGPDRRDVYETPCLGSAPIYDVLVDRRGGPEWHFAVDQARGICGGCSIMAACFRENRDEEWVRAVVTKRSRHKVETQQTPAGEALRARHVRHNADRLADVRHLIEQGANAEDVCKAFGITRSALYKWCCRHDRDAWDALTTNERRAA